MLALPLLPPLSTQFTKEAYMLLRVFFFLGGNTSFHLFIYLKAHYKGWGFYPYAAAAELPWVVGGGRR